MCWVVYCENLGLKIKRHVLSFLSCSAFAALFVVSASYYCSVRHYSANYCCGVRHYSANLPNVMNGEHPTHL